MAENNVNLHRYRFDGDPKLTLDEDGADLTFRGGQPVMDQGFENAAMISLFTDPGWVGNVLAETDAEKIGSDYQAVSREPVTLAALNRSALSARAALQWMLNTGVASDIQAVTRNPRGSVRQTTIKITPPGGYPYELTFAQGGPNWIKQKDDPAYRRV